MILLLPKEVRRLVELAVEFVKVEFVRGFRILKWDAIVEPVTGDSAGSFQVAFSLARKSCCDQFR